MIILGISYGLSQHDSSAAIVVDGSLVAAVEEERLSRRKHDGAIPVRAVQFCLDTAGVTMADVSILAIPELPFRTGPDSNHADLPAAFIDRMCRDGYLRRRSS